MSAQAERQIPSSYREPYDDRGAGWVSFAGLLLVVIGTFNVIDGIAAISNSHFFVGDAHYVFGDLKAWGWTILILGAIQVLVGIGVFAKNQFARWIGVVVLSFNALAQLLMMPAYPFWSLSMFAVDILALYGLVAYGSRTANA